jgi:hypothetical protein
MIDDADFVGADLKSHQIYLISASSVVCYPVVTRP